MLPGFTNAHVHLGGPPPGDGDWSPARLVEAPAQLALLGAAHAQQTLEAGFTTVRVVGTAQFGDIALRNAINAGWVVGPRIVGAGISFGIRGGHCDATDGLRPGLLGPEAGIGIEEGVANGVDEVRNAVRYVVKYGADVIKICATGGVLSLTDSAGLRRYSGEERGGAGPAATPLPRRGAAHARGAARVQGAGRGRATASAHA